MSSDTPICPVWFPGHLLGGAPNPYVPKGPRPQAL